MVCLSFHEEEQFMDVVCCISRLQHPNIVPLVGYSVDHVQHFLVYEHVRNLTLDKALHCKSFLPLTWVLRIQIAVGVAQALDYMHSLSPPVAHCNLKAANIMLDDELMPRVCNIGLSKLRPLTSNSCKVKPEKEFQPRMSEIAEALTRITPKPGTDGVEADAFERSFRSTNTRFLNFPTTIYMPV